MNPYQHTQPGTLLRCMLGFTLLLFGVIGVSLSIRETGALLVVALVLLAVAIAFLLFHSLTIAVDEAAVRVRFGPGLIRKTIPLARITSATIVRNRWFYGWGIRLTPRGWLWNVSGFDAVELEFENGKKFRLGTDDPQGLCAAIRDRITSRS